MTGNIDGKTVQLRTSGIPGKSAVRAVLPSTSIKVCQEWVGGHYDSYVVRVVRVMDGWVTYQYVGGLGPTNSDGAVHTKDSLSFQSRYSMLVDTPASS